MMASGSAAGGFFSFVFGVYVLGVLVAFAIGIMAHGVRKRNRRKVARSSLAWPATLIRSVRGTNKGRTTDAPHTQVGHDTGQIPGAGQSSDTPASPGGGLTIQAVRAYRRTR